MSFLAEVLLEAIGWPVILGLLAWVFLSGPRPIGRRAREHVAAPAPELEPKPQPEPHVPRDLDRPYPRPKGGRRRQDSLCPVCGTGDTTGVLDGRVLGWRAHASCAEWLGDWEPARPEPPPFKPDRSLIGYIEQGQKPPPAGPRSGNCCDGCDAPLGTAPRFHDLAGHRYCGACDREQRRLKQGAYAPPPPAPGADTGRVPRGATGAHAHVPAEDAPRRSRPDRSGLAPPRSRCPACFRCPVRQCRPPPRRRDQGPGLDRGRHLHRGPLGGDGCAGFLLALDPRPGRMPRGGVGGPAFSRMRGCLAGCRGQVGGVLEVPLTCR